VFDCTCNTKNSLLLKQHNGDDAPQNYVLCSPGEGSKVKIIMFMFFVGAYFHTVLITNP